MSVYSMTGYANVVSSVADHDAELPEDSDTPGASRKAGSGSVGAELRSVNSRFLDLSFKLPDEFRGLEPAFRDLLTAALSAARSNCVCRPNAPATAPGPSRSLISCTPWPVWRAWCRTGCPRPAA